MKNKIDLIKNKIDLKKINWDEWEECSLKEFRDRYKDNEYIIKIYVHGDGKGKSVYLKKKDEYSQVFEDVDLLTETDLDFFDNPCIKITYGINNKKEYFEADKVFEHFIKIRKEEHAKGDE